MSQPRSWHRQTNHWYSSDKSPDAREIDSPVVNCIRQQGRQWCDEYFSVRWSPVACRMSERNDRQNWQKTKAHIFIDEIVPNDDEEEEEVIGGFRLFSSSAGRKSMFSVNQSNFHLFLDDVLKNELTNSLSPWKRNDSNRRRDQWGETSAVTRCSLALAGW